MKRSGLITVLMLLGLVGGALYGHFYLHDPSAIIGDDHWTREIGTLILIRPLMLIIIPLVFVSVVVGVASMGGPAKLGLVGGATILLFLTTMLCAATLGTVLVATIRPGDLPPDQAHALTVRADPHYPGSEAVIKNRQTMSSAWMDLIDQLIPTNIVREMSEGRTLGVIVFAILLGMALGAGGMTAQPAIDVFRGLSDALLRIIGWILWIGPIGVFLLVAWTVGRMGLDSIGGSLSKFIVLTIAALALHGLIVLPLVLLLLGRTNPMRFMWQSRKALIMGFGTASKSATMPVTLQTCIEEAGCSRRAADFVVPLGAAINRNGTALFEAIAVVFLCQLYSIDLQFGELLVIVITSTVAAIAAAGIPAAGLVTMVIVINAVNLSLASRSAAQLPESAIGVIVGVDRILDMCRTTINVWGDMVGTKIITRLAPDPQAIDATRQA